jgi:C1A family cysteine protease
MKQNKYGLLLKPSALRKYDYEVCCGSISATSLPSNFEINMDEFTVIKDQGQVNSCVAFASSLVGECENYKRTGNIEKISTGYTYGNEECRKGYMGQGMYMEDTMVGLTKIGFIPNFLFDVNIEMPKIYNMLKYRKDLNEYGQNLKPTAFMSLKTSNNKEKNIQNIKDALYSFKLPVLICSHYYFKEPHCVALYGWDENNNFKYQNSWGEENGRGLITIDDIYDAYILIFDSFELPYGRYHPK